MIIVADNIKMCSIVSSYYADPAYAESIAVAHFREIIYDNLKPFVKFKKTNKKPIRISTSIPAIKRLVTKQKEIFKTITPFGMMVCNESSDDNLGSLISPQNVGFRSDLQPYPLHTQPIYSRMRTYKVDENVEIRLGEATTNYVISFSLYGDTRPEMQSYKKIWDFEIIPGKVYEKEVVMKSIVPKSIVAEYCNWLGRETDFDFFIDDMNLKSNKDFIFKKELDTGTGNFEVILHYTTNVLFRGAACMEPDGSDEEGDEVKYWVLNRSFIMSVNMPTNFLFCRESDKRFPDKGGKIDTYLGEDIRPGKVSVDPNDPAYIASYNATTMINITEVFDEYQLVENYSFTEDELKYIEDNNIKILEIDIFESIVNDTSRENYGFLKYCIDNKLFDKIDEPIKVIIKSDNIIIETHDVLKDNSTFVVRTNVIAKILKDRNSDIYVYFNKSNYREYLRYTRGAYDLPTSSINIKQI